MDIEQRALAMVDRNSGPLGCSNWSDATRTDIIKALIEAIEAGDTERAAHDAFRQEVSDRDERLGEVLCALSARLRLSGFLDDTANHDAYEAVVAAFGKPFIQPKTDPLVEALEELDGTPDPEWSYADDAAKLRAALKSRGLEIREVGQ